MFEVMKQNKYTSLATSVFLIVRRVALAILLHGVMSDYAHSRDAPLRTVRRSMFRRSHIAWFAVMVVAQTMQRHFEKRLRVEDYMSRLREIHRFYSAFNQQGS